MNINNNKDLIDLDNFPPDLNLAKKHALAKKIGK